MAYKHCAGMPIDNINGRLTGVSMLRLIALESWPIWVACCLLIKGAGDYHKLNGRVPNKLTFPAVQSAMLAGFFIKLGWDLKTNGNLFSCLAAAFVAFLIMSIAQKMGGIGAGCVTGESHLNSPQVLRGG